MEPPTPLNAKEKKKKPSSSTKKTSTQNHIQIVKPIIFGSISWWLGKEQSEEEKTHNWTCFVRGPNFEDLSYFIKDVTFSLHPSFPNPNRIVSKAPFEIRESGWGEFEIGIEISFKENSLRPIKLAHFLKLYHTSDPLTLQVQPLDKNIPLVSEHYDEIIFNQPSEYFCNILLTSPKTITTSYSPYLTVFNEQKELNRITQVHKRIRERIKQQQKEYEKNQKELNLLHIGAKTQVFEE